MINLSTQYQEQNRSGIKQLIDEQMTKTPLLQILYPDELGKLLEYCHDITGKASVITNCQGEILVSSSSARFNQNSDPIDITSEDREYVEVNLAGQHKGYLVFFELERKEDVGKDYKITDHVTHLIDIFTTVSYEKIKYSTLYSLLKTAVSALNYPFYLIDADKFLVLIDNLNEISDKVENNSCCELMKNIHRQCEQHNRGSCLVEQVKDSQKSVIIEHSYQDDSGKLKYYEISGYPVFDNYNSKKVKYVITYIIDVTERKEREKSLSRFKQALDSSLDSIFIVDYSTLSFVDVNATACNKLGYTKEDLLQLTPFDIKPYFSREELEEKFEDLLNCNIDGNSNGNCTEIFETYHQRKDGSVYPVEITIRLTNFQEDFVFVIIERDITKQKDTEEKMAEYAMELELSNIKIVELYQKLDEEVDKARLVHERTFPTCFPELDTLEFCAHYQAAEKLGGDFYNAIDIEDHLIFYVSDVTGHGMEGAILSTFIKEAISGYIHFCPNKIEPRNILKYLDGKYRQENFPEDYFISIFMGVLNYNTGELTYSSAGFQEAPKARLSDGTIIELISKSLPITATVPQYMIAFEQKSVQLGRGSTILINSDGLTEQIGQDQNFGEVIDKTTASLGHLPPEVLIHSINERFCCHNGSLQGDDDITLLAVQIKPEIVEHYKWVLDSDFEELERINSEVFSIIKKCDCDECSYHGIHELVTNAIEHGNRFQKDKKVYIEIIKTDKYLLVSVEDEGDGFNWLEKKSVANELDYDGERGRGIIITKQLCNFLVYNWKGNKAYLVVYH